jgi:hypothetical protein
MGDDDRTLGGVCDTMNPTDGGVIQTEQRAEETVASVTLGLEAIYRTDRGDWSEKL